MDMPIHNAPKRTLTQNKPIINNIIQMAYNITIHNIL